MDERNQNAALIGSSGFVGQTLSKQAHFSHHFRSTNIGNIDGGTFDTVVCSAAPAQKNGSPTASRRRPKKNIDGLIAHLSTIQCKTFILISTVDVFKTPVGIDEDTPVDENDLHAYG